MPARRSADTPAVNGAHSPVHARPRNPIAPLDLAWVNSVRVNHSAAERRAATSGTRRSVKKDHQAAWLLRAITCIDLTTLSGDDTPGSVARLCAKARQPVQQEVLDALGVGDIGITVGAVCVYHQRVADAVDWLAGTKIPVAAVSTGFPAGLSPFKQRVEEIGVSVAAGAREIDIVITREHVLTGSWQALYDEVEAFRAACGDAHLKAILATGELATLTNVARANWVAMQAGADFIKTSTGKASVHATPEAARIMLGVIVERGGGAGFKASGGLRTMAEALVYLDLAEEIMGPAWIGPRTFRFGASSLLDEVLAVAARGGGCAGSV